MFTITKQVMEKVLKNKTRVVREFTEQEKKRYKETNSIGFDAAGQHVPHPCEECGSDSRYYHKGKWYCMDHFTKNRHL